MLGDVGLVQDVVKGEVLVDNRGQSFQGGTPQYHETMFAYDTPLYRGQRRTPSKYRKQYESLKDAIFLHLSRRHEFQSALDSALIELTARLLADWFYVEELLSGEALEVLRKRSISSTGPPQNLLFSIMIPR